MMAEHMRASGLALPDRSVSEESDNEAEPGWDQRERSEQPQANGASLPTPSVSIASRAEGRNDFDFEPHSHVAHFDQLKDSDHISGMESGGLMFRTEAGSPWPHQAPIHHDGNRPNKVVHLPAGQPHEDADDGLSPCEARVAGVFHEHGCVASVHGLAGIMNSTSRERHKENISRIARVGEAAIAEAKARLISNAVLQRQREGYLFRQPSNRLDLDGCDPELAKHLLDLHFNRQHYAYLLTYRPAIMEGLASGGSRWLNKLLLNAIYYSSALYSDRQCLRLTPNDVQSAGLHFYRRFKELLVDEIDHPSIPSATALLLTGATLVSQGRSSAGWNLCGTAYRMILDLGCHLTLPSDYKNTSEHSGRDLQRDLEQEMRRRLYWGAYMTDATQALYLGRPCMFASVEARVPLQLLDTFEELEDWQPHVDVVCPQSNQPPYHPHPAHAVSTCRALARLLQISTKITELYGIQAIKLSSETLLQRKTAIENELENWKTSLPEHLSRNPDAPTTPPPHLITPLTTFYALNILLQRAYQEEGHLRRHSDESLKCRGAEANLQSALMILKHVRAYRAAFTLRRAPFLLSYAIYSAVSVIIRHERHNRGQYTEPICFFWTCLHELQRGCNSGLQKPLAILHDLVQELQVSVNDNGSAAADHLQPSFDESFFSTLSTEQHSAMLNLQASETNGSTSLFDQWSVDPFDSSYLSLSPGMLGFMNDQEQGISHDPLYGLFAPSHHFP